MAIDKKIRFGEKVPQLVTPSKNGKRPGYRGDDAYGSSSKSNQATSSRAATSSTNSSAPGGSSGQETRGDGPAPTTFQGNTQIVDTRFDVPLTETIIDPMDIREQYRIGNPINDNPFGKTEVTFNQPYMAQGLETNRYNNYLDSQNLKNYVPDPVNVPFMPLATKGLGILQQFGNDKNTQFFADNVAGKYGYGYGVEDYQQYMSDRMSGKVGAYGNEEQGQNALSGQQSGIAALQGVSTTPQLLSGDEETGELISEDNDMYFNFGTYSNPIYKKDLV